MPVEVKLYMNFKVFDIVTGWVETYYLDVSLPNGRQFIDIHLEYDVVASTRWGYMIVY